MSNTLEQATADKLTGSITKPGFGTKLAVGLLPFSPVQFTGPDALIAWGRLVGYSALAYWTYNKMRPASYAFMGAAGLSLATSLTAGWFSKVGNQVMDAAVHPETWKPAR